MKRRGFFVCFGLALLVWFGLFGPATRRTEFVRVEEGRGVSETASALAVAGVIKWPLVFRLALALAPGPDIVVAGDYYFGQTNHLWQVVSRLTRGDYGLTLVRVTFPEGATAREMAAILEKNLPEFDATRFVAAARPLEGYLFPDTYFFPPTVAAEDIVKRLRANFEEKIKPLETSIAASGRTLEQIVVMASLLEEEAKDREARRVIAGILWKRLDNGVPLQVDAVFPYIAGKNTFELDRNDLATSSPYNTYRFRGLPAGPITNPGLEAIEAALNPMETEYWYYLSDRAGGLHYAVDFDAHRVNKAQYLR